MTSATDQTQLTLAEIFQDGMIFQRNEPIRIWGTAPAAGLILTTITDKNGTILADSQSSLSHAGAFMITLPALTAAEGLSLRVTFAEQQLLLQDLAIGDVWLAGGQSNMEFFLKYDRDFEKVKNLPVNPHIRMYNVPQRAFAGHNTHNHGGFGQWLRMDDDGFENFSAVGFSFAHEIQPQLNVPVGIIGCHWGGSTASTWVPTSVLSKAPLDRYLKAYEREIAGRTEEDLYAQSMEGWAAEDSIENYEHFEPLLYGRDWEWQKRYVAEPFKHTAIPMGPYNSNRPGGLYETMLHELTAFPIKGVIWYQGESDSGELADTYDLLMRGLIEQWRNDWGIKLPFLMVELAPFGKWLECVNDGYLAVRKQQQKVAAQMDDVYLASIMDLGEYYDIHPKQKLEVGRRLALLSLGHVYGFDIACDAPSVHSVAVEGDQIRISFDHAECLTISSPENDLTVTAFDHNSADSTDGHMLDLLSYRAEGADLVLEIKQELASFRRIQVSLGWDDYAEIHIHNEAGLCVAPFCIFAK